MFRQPRVHLNDYFKEKLLGDRLAHGRDPMTGSTAASKKHRRLSGTPQSSSVPEAKAHLSEVISNVEERRQPVTTLRRCRAAAKLIRIKDQKPSLYGSMRATVFDLGDIVAPTGGERSVVGE